jgi:hypothetical protein
MSDDGPVTQLTLRLNAPEADVNELTELAYQLRAELAEMDVEPIEPQPAAPLPEGAKGLPLAVAGEVAVAVRPGGLPDFLGFLRNWLSRQNQQVEITTTIGASTFHISAAITDIPTIMQALGSLNTTAASRSGGADLNADQISVSGDVTGRDKIISVRAEAGATVYIGQTGSTVVKSDESAALPADDSTVC